MVESELFCAPSICRLTGLVSRPLLRCNPPIVSNLVFCSSRNALYRILMLDDIFHLSSQQCRHLRHTRSIRNHQFGDRRPLLCGGPYCSSLYPWHGELHTRGIMLYRLCSPGLGFLWRLQGKARDVQTIVSDISPPKIVLSTSVLIVTMTIQQCPCQYHRSGLDFRNGHGLDRHLGRPSQYSHLKLHDPIYRR